MAAERSKRNLLRVDYKKLSEGPAFSKEKIKTSTWSTSKLYRLNILETKVEAGVTFCLVHYIGWDKKFDEWKQLSEIIDVPEEFLKSSEQAISLFYKQLAITIKEKLTITKREDSFVEIRVPVVRDAFEHLKRSSSSAEVNGKYNLNNLSDLNEILGEGWHYRIVNRNQDFSFIIGETVSFYILERQPLTEFMKDGSLKLIHRGFVLVFRFVRDRGNRFDLQQFLCNN